MILFSCFCIICYSFNLYAVLIFAEKIDYGTVTCTRSPSHDGGNSYTEASLRAAIVEKFGEHQRFYTCSADNMEVDELIGFLKRKGKFMPAGEEFTVDISKVCSH